MPPTPPTRPRKRAETSSVRSALRLLRAAPLALVGLTVVAVAGGTAAAAAAVAAKLFVDGVVDGRSAGQLAGAATLFGAACLLTAAVPELTEYLSAQVSRAARVQTIDRLYQRVGDEPGLESLEQPAYQDRVQLAADAAEMVPVQLVSSVFGTLQATVGVIGLCWVMLTTEPLVAVIAVAGSIPVLVVEDRLARRRVRLRSALMPLERRRQAYTSLIVDPVAGKEIRLFALSRFFRGRMLADLRSVNRSERQVDRLSLAAGLALGGAQVVLTMVVVALAIRGATSNTLSAGELTALITAFGALNGALVQLVSSTARVREGLGLLRTYDDVVEADPTRATGTAAVPRLRRGIVFEDVWFRYADQLPWVLQGVDLTLEAGRSTALVGLNGAGKSTLVKLVCGLYRPTKGRILWDGLDLGTADPELLRDRIGTVFQDYMTYDLTAHENIAVGAIENLADEQATRTAAQRAGIGAELDALPFGYDTMLSRLLYRDPTLPDEDEPRVVLSGGQWQRLALARMLMRADRDLIILDEPSAGLDAVAEHAVHASVQDAMRDRTRLLISHRLSAVRIADRIAVLGDGRIVEEGDHVALMSHRGRYAELFTLQASGYLSAPTEREEVNHVDRQAG